MKELFNRPPETRHVDLTDIDQQLMLRLRKGDTLALSGIVERHQKPLIGFLTRLTGSRERAEDLAQETFLRVLEAGHGYTGEGRFRTWLFTIAYRLHLDLRRRAARRRVRELRRPVPDGTGAVEPEPLEAFADSRATPEEEILRRDTAERVRRVIDDLPELYRAVLHLRGIRELTYAEIGEVLGCSEGAARVRMHKGLALLRDRLKHAGLLTVQGMKG